MYSARLSARPRSQHVPELEVLSLSLVRAWLKLDSQSSMPHQHLELQFFQLWLLLLWRGFLMFQISSQVGSSWKGKRDAKGRGEQPGYFCQL